MTDDVVLEALGVGADQRLGGGGEATVYALDDQRVVREGLSMLVGLLPGIEVVGTAADGEEAVRLAVARAPDVVLMDLRMPRVDGVEATRRLATERPAARVIALTTPDRNPRPVPVRRDLRSQAGDRREAGPLRILRGLPWGAYGLQPRDDLIEAARPAGTR